MAVNGQKQQVSLNHIALYVEDLNKSAAFYKNIIGLDSVPEPFKDGLHAWFKIGNNLTLHLIQGKKENVDQYKNTHTCYSVIDINSFIEHLTRSGITYEDVKGNKNSVTTRVDGVKQVYFKDPDGYWIEINNDKGK
jgi:lactoylglutathione lyase